MFYRPEDRECLQCGETFRVDVESERAFCSDACMTKHNRIEAIQDARRAVLTIVPDNCTARRRARVLFLLDSMVDEPEADSSEGARDAELGFAHERARLDMCRVILEQMAKVFSPELDPRYEAAFREMLAIVRGEREPKDYTDPVLLLARLAEHHEAHKAEPGTIEAEVAAYLARFS